MKFVEIDSFTITQRRDSSVLDKEMTKRYGGVKTFKDIVIVDTLGFISVKDSLFGFDDRYLSMMYVPFSKDDQTRFQLNGVRPSSFSSSSREQRSMSLLLVMEKAIRLEQCL